MLVRYSHRTTQLLQIVAVADPVVAQGDTEAPDLGGDTGLITLGPADSDGPVRRASGDIAVTDC